MSITKPEYKVPSMVEINQIPYNGYTVVSTFSGGGGSCLGYRMAGYRVAYANEFVEEAQKTYRANHKDTYLDTRDIRNVKPEEILQIIGMNKGEVDLFDGSPPCCAFSTAGKREKSWGKKRAYSDGKSQQIEDLFLEYIRLLDGIQPKTFVAENVSGMVKGSALGYFKEYLAKMKSCGYNVKAKLLNAKWLGVPQARQRIIFVGIRKDFGVEPIFPQPFSYYYTLQDAFVDLPKSDELEIKALKEAANRYKWGSVLKKIPLNPKMPIQGSEIMGGSYFNLVRESMNRPCSTICQKGGNASANGPCHPMENRKFTISELKRITSVPDDFVLTGSYSQQWERLGRMVPPVMMMHIANTIKSEVLDKL